MWLRLVLATIFTVEPVKSTELLSELLVRILMLGWKLQVSSRTCNFLHIKSFVREQGRKVAHNLINSKSKCNSNWAFVDELIEPTWKNRNLDGYKLKVASVGPSGAPYNGGGCAVASVALSVKSGIRFDTGFS